MKLNNSEQTNYWYQYMGVVNIYNAFDSACEAMNGADKDELSRCPCKTW